MDEAAFAEARAVLAGQRVLLDATGAKILQPMMRDPIGADLALTPARCIYDTAEGYGGMLVQACIPSVLSWLLDQMGVTAPITAHAGLVEAGHVAAFPPYSPAWPHGLRAVWIASSAERITIVVRDGATPDVLATRPAPIVVEEYLAATWACPRCTAVPERYRRLGSSAVCLACGASSSIPG